jgi:peptidase YpeB-like protein
MHWSRKYAIVGGSVLAIAAGGTGAALALGSGDEGDHGATGPQADQATAAALKLYPGGHANAVERDSENGATWEVEVAKSDGSTVDVRLDQNYKLVVAEADSEGQGGN